MKYITFSNFRKMQLYIPGEFRDSNIHGFHNQKDFFRILWNHFGEDASRLGWVDFHVTIIDFFLYGLARYGYCLTSSRKEYNFLNYDALASDMSKSNTQLLKSFLDNTKEQINNEVVSDVIRDENPMSLEVKVSKEVEIWIEKKEHLPVELRDEETLGLVMAFLVVSISCDDNFVTKKVTSEDRVSLSRFFLDTAAKFGYVLRKHNRDGDFNDLMEIIEPYREDYRQLKAKANSEKKSSHD